MSRFPHLRYASCAAITTLSRADDKMVRVSLCNIPEIWEILSDLITDVYLEVKINAVGMICNLALELQSKKTDDFTNLISKLVELTRQTTNLKLRKNALFAIKNFSFMCTKDIRSTIISHLGLKELYHLLDDEDPSIQMQALCIYRNLVYKTPDDINEVLGSGDQLLNKLYEKLFSSKEDIIIHSIYVCSNIANGNEKHRALFMDDKYIKRFYELLVWK